MMPRNLPPNYLTGKTMLTFLLPALMLPVVEGPALNHSLGKHLVRQSGMIIPSRQQREEESVPSLISLPGKRASTFLSQRMEEHQNEEFLISQQMLILRQAIKFAWMG